MRVVYNTPHVAFPLLCFWTIHRVCEVLTSQNQSVQLRLIMYPSAHWGFRYEYRHCKGKAFAWQCIMFQWKIYWNEAKPHIKTRYDITSYGMMGSFIKYHSVNISNSNSLFTLFTQKSKNSGLRRSISRCNRSVDQPGLEPGTSRLWVCCSLRHQGKRIKSFTF